MKKIIILIASCLSAVVATKAETEIEKKVKQVILDNNAYALKNLKFKAKMISKEGALEFWSSGGLLHSPQQNDKVREFDTYNMHPKHIQVIEINPSTAVALPFINAIGSTPTLSYHKMKTSSGLQIMFTRLQEHQLIYCLIIGAQ